MAGAPAGSVLIAPSLASVEPCQNPCQAVILTDLVGTLGRETFLVKVDWVDDWPVFNEGRNITLLTRGRESLVERVQPGGVPLEWQADLQKPDLELGWYQKSKRSSTFERVAHVKTGSFYRYTAEAVILAH